MHTSSRTGSSLLMTVSFVAVFSLAIGGAVTLTTHLGRNESRTRALESGLAVGDAYLEWAYAQWRSACRTQGNNTQLRTSGGTSPFTVSAPPAAWLGAPEGYTVVDYSVKAADVELNTSGGLIATAGVPPAIAGEDNGDNSYYYLATVKLSMATMLKKPLNIAMHRVFEKHIESPWRYAIFYNDMLELHPSPTFAVDGWVHTNDSMYVAPDGGNPLTFGDRVTYADTYFQGYAPGDYAWRGRSTAAGAAPAFDPGITATNEVRHDFFGITPDQFSTADSNPNNDGYRELIERPNTSYSDPLTDGNGDNPRLYNTAGIKVLVDASNNLTIMKVDGTVLSSTTGTTAEKATYNAVQAAISTGSTIQDFREAATVRLVSLDVSQLVTQLNAGKISGWNGVIYISDTSAGQTGGTPKRGVRIRNGAQLPTNGLTVVSDNPVYLQGNYNTAGTRQAAAVIGDAVMILSANWNDANSSADIGSGSRTATSTTVNAAILAGNVPTNPALSPSNTAYSGGVENFPRFMENWSGATFTYNGSMVQLFSSRQAIGRWGSSSQAYNPPIRKWAFDPMFRTNPPPGSLFTTTYIKQQWYLE